MNGLGSELFAGAHVANQQHLRACRRHSLDCSLELLDRRTLTQYPIQRGSGGFTPSAAIGARLLYVRELRREDRGDECLLQRAGQARDERRETRRILDRSLGAAEFAQTLRLQG